MLNSEQLNLQKAKIIETIQKEGPKLPIHLAKSIDSYSLLTSAILSELVKDQKLKMSNMRVGSSPLYFLPGQESQLENFIGHLNQREKQALSFLKTSQILEDKEQEPVVRVALRSIPDFAIPIKVRAQEETKLFWKYYTLQDDKARALLKNLMTPEKQPEQKLEQPLQKQKIAISEPQKELQQQIPKQKPIKKQKEKIFQEYEFPKKIKEHLKTKDIELLEALTEKKKEFTAKIRIDTLFGKQLYYLIAKEKKKITENDLTLAIQKAQTEKMPSLILSIGDLDKKANLYLTEWNNLIKFEKISF